MRKILIAVSLLAWSSQFASAEPSPATRWLMKEPMTLMDWGLFKASNSLKEIVNLIGRFPEEIEPYSATAEYDWDENKIRLKAVFAPPNFLLPCAKDVEQSFANRVLVLRQWPASVGD